MTLSADERAAIEARHGPVTMADKTTIRCEHDWPADDFDDTLWPCDTEKMRAALVDCERLRWHHSPDAPPEHFCADCDEQSAALVAAEAEIERVKQGNIDLLRATAEVNDASEARAKALAEALKRYPDEEERRFMWWRDVAVPALAAYREAGG